MKIIWIKYKLINKLKAIVSLINTNIKSKNIKNPESLFLWGNIQSILRGWNPLDKLLKNMIAKNGRKVKQNNIKENKHI